MASGQHRQVDSTVCDGVLTQICLSGNVIPNHSATGCKYRLPHSCAESVLNILTAGAPALACVVLLIANNEAGPTHYECAPQAIRH